VPSTLTELLQDLAAVFDRKGVRWYLFGAQAAILHGSPRLSADVDVTVALGEGSLTALLKELAAAGFSARVADPRGFAERTHVVPLAHEKSTLPVDLVLAGPGLEERFLEGAQVHDLDGVAVPVASAEDMIAMKILAGRPKDLEDACSILRARGRDLDLGRVRATLGDLEQALDRRDLLPALEALRASAGL
jgi:hypothetical protein